MLNGNAYQHLVDVFDTINNSLEDAEDSDENPEELFQHLNENVNRPLIEFFDSTDTEVKVKPVSEFEGVQEKWPCVIGLDSSNTRTLRFDSGEVATASLAAFGVDGNSKRQLKQYQTLNAVVFSLNPDFSLQDVEVDEEGVNIEMLQFPRSASTEQIESWVQGVSLLHSEFNHPYNVLDELDAPLLIDGPLYSGNFFWFLRYKYNQVNAPLNDPIEQLSTPVNVWNDKLLEMFQKRIDTIDRFYKHGHPAIGVVKTTNSSVVLESIREGAKKAQSNPFKKFDDSKIRWHKDMTFFNELLQVDENKWDEAVLSYTPWLKETFIQISGEKMKPFDDYDGLELELQDQTRSGRDAYNRAFFYVKVPYHQFCLRIEAPVALVRKMGDDIQELILYQIASDANVPGPIMFADESAKISEEARNKLRGRIKASTTDNFNEHRGYISTSKDSD